MSFSAQVKTELCRVPIQKRCCAQAEAYGALLYANSFAPEEIRIITGCPDFRDRLPRLFRRAFGLDFDGEESRAGGRQIALVITDRAKIRAIFAAFGFDTDQTLAHHINLGVLENDCCRMSFLRGAFLAGGSITDPMKRYHLELVTDHYSVARETYAFLRELGFTPHDATRKGNYITYFKQSEAIEDFFTTIGATTASMSIMEAKVEKDMRNAVNRKVNCDTANADKTVAASMGQLEALRALDEAVGIANLPDKLRDAALLRIANPEASLADLSLLSNPRVTKSCLSHRLKKLADMARELNTVNQTGGE